MIIKQIAIDEALELHKRGLMVGVLQPVVPEPKNLDDYEFLTLKEILDGCEFFRIVLEEEKRETEPAEKELGEVAKPKVVEEKPTETAAETKEKPESPKSEATNKKQIDFGKMKALRNAGWSMKQIAEELQLAPSTVCGYLKKMEEGNAEINRKG